MKLSDHFTLKELTTTNTGFENKPGFAEQNNLTELCVDILEAIRKLLNSPLKITSGFRSDVVNLAVKGSPISQHMDGNAADFFPTKGNLMAAYQTIKSSAIEYDQLILEPGWIHVSRSKKPRRQAFIK